MVDSGIFRRYRLGHLPGGGIFAIDLLDGFRQGGLQLGGHLVPDVIRQKFTDRVLDGGLGRQHLPLQAHIAGLQPFALTEQRLQKFREQPDLALRLFTGIATDQGERIDTFRRDLVEDGEHCAAVHGSVPKRVFRGGILKCYPTSYSQKA